MQSRKVSLWIRAAGTAIVVLLVGGAAAIAGSEESTSLEEVWNKADKAMDAIESYSVEQRDQAVASVKETVADLDRAIDRLEVRIADEWSKMDEAARENARSALKSLREKRNELSEWLGGLKYGSAKAWEEIKEGFIDGFEAFRESFDRTVREI
jgi:hypothetical protein